MNGVSRRGGRSSLRRRLRYGVCLAVLCLPLPAIAQPSTAGLQKEFDVIYQRLLVDPSDRALNRRMIEIALALDDYDAAIGAVERLIFYQPNNPNLQLEAARLYFRIDSYAAARGYLNDALAMPSATAQQRKEISALIAEIDKKTKPSIWGGLAQVGIRHQSNANIGSDLPGNIDPGGFDPFPFEPSEADWNSFALGTLGLADPVGKNLILEGSLSLYYADQFKVDRLDLGFAEITGGPRIASDSEKLSIKPYGIAQGILLGSDPYQLAYGGGVMTRLVFADGWWLEPQVEYKKRIYYESEDYLNATDQDGYLITYAGNLHGEFSERVSLTSRIAYNQNRAATDFNSYDQYFANLTARFDFDIFDWKNWSFSPFASASFTQYLGLLDPDNPDQPYDIIRHDLQWSVGANLEIPLHEHAVLGAQVQFTKNDSNFDRYTYENLQFLLGPLTRF